MEENTFAFANLLKDAAGVPMSSLGVSGSVLVGLHRPGSDVDLAVYGEGNHRRYTARSGVFWIAARSPFAASTELNWPRCMLPIEPIPRSLFRTSFGSSPARQTRAISRAIPYFIRFIKGKREGEQRYGDTSYEPLGKATIRFRVTDDGDAIFTPCRYSVEDVLFLDRAGEPICGRWSPFGGASAIRYARESWQPPWGASNAWFRVKAKSTIDLPSVEKPGITS